MSRAEYEEDLQAELGYRTAGRREIAQREWFSLRGEAGEIAPNPKAFAKLVNVLRVTKWAKANPEKRKVIANRYAAKPGVSSHQAAMSKKRRHEAFHAAAPVIVCAECGVAFCPIAPPRGGKPRKYCTVACMLRERYQRITPGARRVKRTGFQP